MFNQCKNTKKQGDIGIALAISKLASKGYTVLFPLCDSEPYDLVFDDGGKLNKVQVKTTSQKSKNSHGGYILNLRVMGGNQSFHTQKKFDPSLVDYVFGLTEDGKQYLIPSKDIVALTAITLGPDKDKYLV
jgi:hypothetical protein